jgi:FMN reductase
MDKLERKQLLVVGIGGTVAPGSSTHCALQIALASAAQQGARTILFGHETLANLPHYLTAGAADTPVARSLIRQVREADGVIIASPGYHGTISGVVKNAIDYLEETSRDARPYLDGVAVGLITTAYGWQAAVSTLAALRSVAHALRGWPTPFGAAINCSGNLFRDGECSDPMVIQQLTIVGLQVFEFAYARACLTHGQIDIARADLPETVGAVGG